ncbi:hypothetical protein BJX65DRAFT_314389 [Aspergillus insuetus]
MLESEALKADSASNFPASTSETPQAKPTNDLADVSLDAPRTTEIESSAAKPETFSTSQPMLASNESRTEKTFPRHTDQSLMITQTLTLTSDLSQNRAHASRSLVSKSPRNADEYAQGQRIKTTASKEPVHGSSFSSLAGKATASPAVPKSAIPSQSDNAAAEPTFALPKLDISQVSRDELYEKATKYMRLYANALKEYTAENAQLTHERKALEDTIRALRASLHEHTTELDKLRTELALLSQEKNTMRQLLEEIREGNKWLSNNRWHTR